MVSDDVICAFATAEGLAALAVLRISGAGSANLADKIFRFGPIKSELREAKADSALKKRKVVCLKGYQAAYGHVVDPLTGEIVDEVVLTRFKAPRSYTGEEMVEISCHGGAISKMKLLTACLRAGSRMATAGEFSKRAFLNGKFSLIEAEGLADLLNAEAEEAQTLALQQLSGELGYKFKQVRDLLLEFAAKCEMGIEYPEYPEHDIEQVEYLSRLKAIKDLLSDLCAGYDQGRIIKEGIKIALLGAPNAGKSSLMNALVHEDKAIVTNIPGTTRDVLEAEVRYKGLLCQYCDTAGLRAGADIVEQEGIKRSFKTALEADVVLWLISVLPRENSANLATDSLIEHNLTQAILPSTDLLAQFEAKGTQVYFVVSKSDLAEQAEIKAKIEDLYGEKYKVLSCSVLQANSLAFLQAQIYAYYLSLGKGKSQAVRVSSYRQYQGLYNISCIIDTLTADYGETIPPLDVLDQMLQACIEEIELLTGEKADEAVLTTIFSKFCVGK